MSFIAYVLRAEKEEGLTFGFLIFFVIINSLIFKENSFITQRSLVCRANKASFETYSKAS